MPGTGGAPPNGDGPGPPDPLPTIGADRSFVTAFFRAFPLVISERRAPYRLSSVLCPTTPQRLGVNEPFQHPLLACAREGRQEGAEVAEEGLRRRLAGEEEEVVVAASRTSDRWARIGYRE